MNNKNNKYMIIGVDKDNQYFIIKDMIFDDDNVCIEKIKELCNTPTTIYKDSLYLCKVINVNDVVLKPCFQIGDIAFVYESKIYKRVEIQKVELDKEEEEYKYTIINRDNEKPFDKFYYEEELYTIEELKENLKKRKEENNKLEKIIAETIKNYK